MSSFLYKKIWHGISIHTRKCIPEKVNGLTSERDGLKSQLDERDQQLVDLQKNSKNVKLIQQFLALQYV